MFRSYLLVLFLVLVGPSSSLASADKLVRVDNSQCTPWNINGDPAKIVCVCRAGQCHEIDFEWPEQSGQAILVQSSRLGRRFEATNPAKANRPGKGDASTTIRVKLAAKRQKIIGWGGAFTDAAGVNLNGLPSETAELLLASYFGKQGLRYNMARVPIGGTDFSTRAYTYDDSEEPDLELKKWSLASEDMDLKIPHVKRAMEMVEERGDKLKLFASPWSAPKWMKTNKSLVRGHLINSDEIYASYTKYLMKFYDAYEQHGIEFWGATVQNEPGSAYLPVYFFNSMQFSSSEMRKLITKHLGPAMRARGWTKDNFKLMVGDDSLGFIDQQCPSLLRDKEVLEYTSGLAFHWYTSGTIVSYRSLEKMDKEFGDKIEFMLMTEASTGSIPFFRDQTLGSWSRAESYAADIIEDLSRNTAGWVDWNLALDMGGGPNWSGNFVDSPIKVDVEKAEFYKQPMYYALAHFSRLFLPGSVRLDTEVKGNFMSLFDNVLAIAVHNEQSGHLVLNILNKSTKPRTIKVHIEADENDIQGPQVEPFLVEAKSISSLVIKL